MEALAARALAQLPSLSLQHTSSFINAFAVFDMRGQPLAGAAVPELLSRAATAGAFPVQVRRLRCPPLCLPGGGPPAFGALRAGCRRHQSSPSQTCALLPRARLAPPQVSSNLLWGLALLGEASLAAWQMLLGQIVAWLLRHDPAAEAEAPAGASAAPDGAGAGCAGAATQLPKEALTQIFQSYMLMQLRFSARQLQDAAEAAHVAVPCLAPAAASGRLGPAVSEVLGAARAQWERSVADVFISDFHREVSEAVRALGVAHVLEQRTADGLFSVDIALAAAGAAPPAGGSASGSAGGGGGDDGGGGDGGGGEHQEPQGREGGGSGAAGHRRRAEHDLAVPGAGGGGGGADDLRAAALAARLAIEVDGPSHFSSNTREFLGLTLARRRLLEARGWRVHSVPYFDWAALPAGGAGKREYVGRLLQEMGVAHGGGEDAQGAGA
jgi:hypothetical protein